MLVWAGLWRKKTRTILTVMSITVAFLLFGLLQGVHRSIRSGLGDNSNSRLWTRTRASDIGSMPIAFMDRIRTVKGVRAIAHFSFFGGYFRDSRNSVGAYATNVGSLAEVYPELDITPAQIDAMHATRAGALIGRPLAQKYGWRVGDQIPLGTTIWTNPQGSNTWIFDIVGIFDPTPQFAHTPLGNGFWINYEYFDEGRRYDKHRVYQFVIQTDDPLQSTAVSSAIDQLFENSSDETRTQTENAALRSQLRQFVDVDFIVNSVVGAVMFALLFATANTMAQSLRERIPELAVLRTLGFSTGIISVLILVESLLLCVGAAVVGLLLAGVAIRLVGSLLAAPGLPLTVIISGISIAVVLAILSAVVPALHAQRLNIVDALAHR